MLFIWRGSLISTVMPQLLIVLAIASFATLTHGKIFHYQVELTAAPFTLLGVSLAIFLGFRNSASYDRYWEARKLLGNLLNISRSLARQAMTLGGLDKSDPRAAEFINLLAAFTHAMRHQLRRSDPSEDLARLLPPKLYLEVQDARFRPVLILTALGQWVVEGMRQGNYGEITAAAFDSNLNGLSDVLGGCERLSNTPLPYPYSVMIHRTLYFYCFLLPFGLVTTVGDLTPLISVLIAYTFIVLEALADEIEEPFGTAPNDLPLESISFTIERSLLEMIGKPLREPIPNAQEYVLL